MNFRPGVGSKPIPKPANRSAKPWRACRGCRPTSGRSLSSSSGTTTPLRKSGACWEFPRTPQPDAIGMVWKNYGLHCKPTRWKAHFMNDPWIRNQLRSWQPRRPSPGLRNRIFNNQAVAQAANPGQWSGPPAFRPAWWVPALACLAVLANLQWGGLETGHMGRLAILQAEGTPSALMLQNAAALSLMNSPSRQSFTWTNQPLNPTTNGSLSGIN